jgi:hypothetical protein
MPFSIHRPWSQIARSYALAAGCVATASAAAQVAEARLDSVTDGGGL